MSAHVIAIDGPAASGKSTLARALAEKLGILYVNTGSLYRAVGWKALANGVGTKDAAGLCAMLKNTSMRYAENAQGALDIEIDGSFPGAALRTAEIAQAASDVATVPEVRAFTLEIQRDTAKTRRVVMEGRDIGTVVFPDAEYKFFLTASPRARALRRLRQDGETPDGATVDSVAAQIAERDRQDSERAAAPLKQAADAIPIDNSELDCAGTLDLILGYLHL